MVGIVSALAKTTRDRDRGHHENLNHAIQESRMSVCRHRPQSQPDVEWFAVTRLESLLSALKKFYGALPSLPRDPFTLFVWEVVSVHSTPRKRDAALAALRRIPALTPDSMWRVPQKKLEQSIALAGPYLENRLQALRTGVELFRRSPDLVKTIRGPLPAARRALKPFPQLGETGAHRMLLFAADQVILPVDARVIRVARRLGYGAAAGDFKKQSRSVQDALARELTTSADAYRRAFLYLSHHGGATCTESDPHCSICPLLKDCPDGQKRVGIGE
jgi:endonuclease III